MLFIDPIRNFYSRFERPISSISLIAGFVFDAVTLKRVDTLWENIWILGHLIIVAVFIFLIHLHKRESGSEKNPQKAHFWYVNILQFVFGGILSTYLVFYFRSADIFTAWPFILLLVGAFIANESLKKHYIRLSFQISLFYLSIYAFAIFLVPVLLHRIGAIAFIVSGILSIITIAIFLKILFYFIKDKFSESRKLMLSLILGITVIINILYFTNLIPPIPLSLKDAGVFHSIQKNPDGNYTMTYEKGDWKGFFNFYPDFKITNDAPIYAFSSIFSPDNLNLNIIHEWQYFDTKANRWVTDSEIDLPVIGGRDGGYRTYSVKVNIQPGKWRIKIRTESNQNIGYLRFNIVNVDTLPVVIKITK